MRTSSAVCAAVVAYVAVGHPAPALAQAFPEARCFGIVSAANPAQIMRSDPENRSADRALQRRLDDLDLVYRAAFVAAHSRSWKAFNWLVVDPDPAVFDALAAEFGQIGTLLWARGEPVRLRMHAHRPAGVAPHPWIDWIDEAGGLLPAPTGAMPPSAP